VVFFALLLATVLTIAMRMFQKHELQVGVPE
jgi:hypothetical protein